MPKKTAERRSPSSARSQGPAADFPPASPKWHVWGCAVVLAALGFFALGPVIDCDFVNYDDHGYVTENQHVRAGLTTEGFRWAWTTFHAANWHPLTWLSLMLDSDLFGTGPRGYHFTNLLLHLANTLLVFGFLLRATGWLWRSALVGALFAVHPLHVESVAWVSERKDVLSTFFGLLALLAYVRYAERPGIGRYVLVVVAFALSLLAKPMLVTLPCLLLLLDYWPLNRWPRPGTAPLPGPGVPGRQMSLGWLCLEKIPLLALSAVSSLVTLWAQGEGGAIRTLRAFSLPERFANAAVSYVQYLRQTVGPVDLAVFYPHPGQGLGIATVAGAVALLAGITALALRLRPWAPYVIVGWLWFLGTLVPVVGLVQVGIQARADRYMYLPVVGVLVAVVWGVAEWVGHSPGKKVAAGAAVVALVGCVSLSRDQVRHWSNSVTLWQHAIQVAGGSNETHESLGSALMDQGRTDEAAKHFREALRFKPDSHLAYLNLGAAAMRQGRPDEAVACLQKAIQLGPRDFRAYVNLGMLRTNQGAYDEAAELFRQAIQLAPDNHQAQLNLGTVELFRGRPAEAARAFEEAVRLAPNDFRGYLHLGMLRISQAAFTDAADLLKQAVRLAPERAETHHFLGLVLGLQGSWADALPHLRQAVELQPAAAEYRCDLGLALYEQGLAGAARAEFQEALRLNPGWPESTRQAAWILATHPEQRNGRMALRMARHLQFALGERDPAVLDLLAATHAADGNFAEAVNVAKAARAAAEAAGQGALAKAIEDRLRRYEARQPAQAP